ncbi:MAG: ABC transporter ATP-binding protein [Thermodesulfobacteriota bacterium]
MSLLLENVDIRSDGVPYLDSVNLEFKRGNLYTILGRTLAGKTTLLRTIAGLQKPQQGAITLHGRQFLDIPVWKRNVAMVYQQFINYPHLNVMSNVTFPLLKAGVPKAEARRRAAEVLAKVGLEGLETRRPSALSGGQQQRVALARALVKNAEILLLDEPLVNLDYKLREQLREEFLNIFQGQNDAIVIYTTTDPAEAIQWGHELIIMDKGAIIQQDKPLAAFNAPANIRCAEVINDPPMNMFEGAVAGGLVRLKGDVSFALPRHMSGLKDGRYVFGVRAMDLAIGREIESRVTLSEISGSQTIVHLSGAIGHFIVFQAGVHHYAIGNTVQVDLSPERLYAYATDGALVSAPAPALSPGS